MTSSNSVLAFIEAFFQASHQPPPIAEIFLGDDTESTLLDAIPIPDDVSILGGILYADKRQMLLLRSENDVRMTFAAYEEAFIDSGWQFVEEYPTVATGFIEREGIGKRFCDAESSMALVCQAFETDTGCVIRMEQQPHEQPCKPIYTDFQTGIIENPKIGDQQALIPPLKTPAATTLITETRTSGEHSTSDAYATRAVSRLLTDMPLADLLAHFDAQLAATGWEKQTDEVGTHQAASRWMLPVEPPCSAIFVLVRDPLRTNEIMSRLDIYQRKTPYPAT